MTWRRLRTLIRHLPPESATLTGLRNRGGADAGGDTDRGDPAEGPWSQAEMLIAALVDELRLLRCDFQAANSDLKKARKIKPPRPIPRPGVKPDRPTLDAEQAEFLFRHINGLPQEPGVRFTLIKGGG